MFLCVCACLCVRISLIHGIYDVQVVSQVLSTVGLQEHKDKLASNTSGTRFIPSVSLSEFFPQPSKSFSESYFHMLRLYLGIWVSNSMFLSFYDHLYLLQNYIANTAGSVDSHLEGLKKLNLRFTMHTNQFLSGEYSGGMKRKLSCAISLLGWPKVIFNAIISIILFQNHYHMVFISAWFWMSHRLVWILLLGEACGMWLGHPNGYL